MKRKFLFLITCLVLANYLSGQNIQKDSLQQANNNLTVDYKALIIPTILIGYGVVGIESDGLKLFNSEIKEELNEYVDEKLTADDFSQYAPFLTVYGLNALGIKGKNSFKDRTIILGTAYLIMGSTVSGIKNIAAIERPDGSGKTSFPSGHTATAFMGAEFLYQEYKDISVWYGVAGYVVATGTGFFRMYNDRHWFTDVVTGAGIGILSTKIAYWIHPWMKEKIFRNKKETTAMVVPFYNGKELGVSLSMSF
uniref:phosphatase PAP2 family protein n=1 Tax=uncultured Draconibacterium sp. TaxID=1573823 RepID=UPI0032166EA4